MNGHVALFLPDLSAGGAEKVILSLAGEFARRGHSVELVVSTRGGELSESVPSGVSVVDLGCPPSSVSKLRFVLLTLARLSSYLRNRQPSCLLSTLTGANLAATAATLIAGKPSPALLLREASSHHNVSSGFRKWMMRRLYPASDACIAVSQGIYDDLITTYGLRPEAVHIIHNPVDMQTIVALAAEPVSHRWMSPVPKAFAVAVGRLKPEKGFDYLIREFHSIRDKTDINLLILGEGPERGNLETLIGELKLSSRIDMPGYLDNPFPLIAKSRLFVLSSRWEGFPNVLLQALALGVPVVATDCHSGPAEILNNGEYGRLVASGKKDALAQAILETLDHSTDASLLRARASNYSLTKIADQYLELIRRMLHNPHELAQ